MLMHIGSSYSEFCVARIWKGCTRFTWTNTVCQPEPQGRTSLLQQFYSFEENAYRTLYKAVGCTVTLSSSLWKPEKLAEVTRCVFRPSSTLETSPNWSSLLAVPRTSFLSVRCSTGDCTFTCKMISIIVFAMSKTLVILNIYTTIIYYYNIYNILYIHYNNI